MSKFKLGDEVVLRDDVAVRNQNFIEYSLQGVRGVVTGYEGERIEVHWLGGGVYVYKEEDLYFWVEPIVEQPQLSTTELPVGKIKSTGASSSYYDLNVSDDLLHRLNTRSEEGRCYIKTEEIIHYLLDDSFPFGTAFKSLVRALQETRGGGKEGNDLNYECNKIKYYADSIFEYYGGKDETCK